MALADPHLKCQIQQAGWRRHPPSQMPVLKASSHLLSHDRQDLQVNPVELIEARPGTAGSKALEELALETHARNGQESGKV